MYIEVTCRWFIECMIPISKHVFEQTDIHIHVLTHTHTHIHTFTLAQQVPWQQMYVAYHVVTVGHTHTTCTGGKQMLRCTAASPHFAACAVL